MAIKFSCTEPFKLSSIVNIFLNRFIAIGPKIAKITKINGITTKKTDETLWLILKLINIAQINCSGARKKIRSSI